MNDRLTELLALLGLERIEENLFRGQSQDLGWGRVYGGQVIGQALSAAEQTVPPERMLHAMHGDFLRPGDARRPVVYMVDPIRDGRSFTTRRVVAVQDGKAIFSLSASFQVPEGGLEHADPMPEVPGPEGLPSERDVALRFADKLPPPIREQAIAPRPIEVRFVEVADPERPAPRPPRRQVWMRAAHALPDAPRLHQYLLAYASDSHFLTAALQPHGLSWLSPGMQLASLDHAMWFHRDLRFDDWLLYDVDSPTAQGARGFVRGRFFDRAGRLVASTAQEGLMRQWS